MRSHKVALQSACVVAGLLCAVSARAVATAGDDSAASIGQTILPADKLLAVWERIGSVPARGGAGHVQVTVLDPDRAGAGLARIEYDDTGWTASFFVSSSSVGCCQFFSGQIPAAPAHRYGISLPAGGSGQCVEDVQATCDFSGVFFQGAQCDPLGGAQGCVTPDPVCCDLELGTCVGPLGCTGTSCLLDADCQIGQWCDRIGTCGVGASLCMDTVHPLKCLLLGATPQQIQPGATCDPGFGCAQWPPEVPPPSCCECPQNVGPFAQFCFEAMTDSECLAAGCTPKPGDVCLPDAEICVPPPPTPAEILASISDGSCDPYITNVTLRNTDPRQASVVTAYGAAGFPTNGADFVLLSSGDPFAPAQGTDLDYTPPDTCRGDHVAIDISFDFGASAVQSILFDFDFFSYEFPEFVGSPFNDYVFGYLDGTPIQFNFNCEPSPSLGCLITKDSDGAQTNVNNAFFKLCSDVGCDSPAGNPGWSTEFLAVPGDDAGRTGTLRACTPLNCPPVGPPPAAGNTGMTLVSNVHTLTLLVGDVGDGIFTTAGLFDNLRCDTNALCLDPRTNRVCAADVDCDDLDPCNGVETCDQTIGQCVAGTPPGTQTAPPECLGCCSLGDSCIADIAGPDCLQSAGALFRNASCTQIGCELPEPGCCQIQMGQCSGEVNPCSGTPCSSDVDCAPGDFCDLSGQICPPIPHCLDTAHPGKCELLGGGFLPNAACDPWTGACMPPGAPPQVDFCCECPQVGQFSYVCFDAPTEQKCFDMGCTPHFGDVCDPFSEQCLPPVVATATPSATATSTPTSSPSVTPTATSSATPVNTSTQTPTATATATPTATPACTSGGCAVCEVCDPLVGCVPDPNQNGQSCDDGDACTTGTTCSSGQCTGGSSVDCSHLDDACHVGTCDPASGGCVAQLVVESPSCGSCEDGLDNDGDSLIDAKDPDCATFAACQDYALVGMATSGSSSVRIGLATHVQAAPGTDPISAAPYPVGDSTAGGCGYDWEMKAQSTVAGGVAARGRVKFKSRGVPTTVGGMFVTEGTTPTSGRNVSEPLIGPPVLCTDETTACTEATGVVDCAGVGTCEVRRRLTDAANAYVDTSGTAAELLACQTALSGIPSMVVPLVQGLTPTMSVGEVKLKAGQTRTINVGAGSQVVLSLDLLRLSHKAKLILSGDPSQTVVVRIGKTTNGRTVGPFRVGRKAEIRLNGLLPRRVLFSVEGDRPRTAKLSLTSVVAGTILAPEQRVVIGRTVDFTGKVIADRVTTRNKAVIHHVPFTSLLVP